MNATESDCGPATVEPRLLKGFRDSLPGEMLLRNRMIATIRGVYERYGFAPLDTPAAEHLDVLLGKYGDEGSRDIFRLASPEGEAMGLRFDLTVPLARVVAQYRELPTPFRRYQVSPVWRADKPGPGRFREFMQFDIDTVGTSSIAADVEILAAVSEAMAALALPPTLIRVSSRRLLNALLAYAGLPAERASDVFRVLDKLDRIGLEAVKLELTGGRVDASGDRIPGLGLDSAAVDKVEAFLSIPRERRTETLARVADLFHGVAGSAEAIGELASIDEQLSALGLGSDRVQLDVTLARGLAYYTGPIFEANLPDAPEFGSIFGGGRYDGLVERFLGHALPGTGGSLGVDRILAALVRLGVVRSRPSPTQVLVTVIDPTLMAEYQRLAGELRAAGVAAEVYLGSQKGLKKQLAYADRLQIPIAVLLGGDELAAGEVSVKDLVEGARLAAPDAGREEYLKARFGQQRVRRDVLVGTIRTLLEEPA